MFSLQTKRAIYLTKTPFQLQCKLHNRLFSWQSVSCDRSQVRLCFERRNVFKSFVFRCEATILRALFGDQNFSIWRLKKKFHSPLGARIKKLISDPGGGGYEKNTRQILTSLLSTTPYLPPYPPHPLTLTSTP